MEIIEMLTDLVIKTQVGNYYANESQAGGVPVYWATPTNSQAGGAFDPLMLTSFENIPHVIEHRPTKFKARVDDSQPTKVRRTSKHAKRH